MSEKKEVVENRTIKVFKILEALCLLFIVILISIDIIGYEITDYSIIILGVLGAILFQGIWVREEFLEKIEEMNK